MTQPLLSTYMSSSTYSQQETKANADAGIQPGNNNSGKQFLVSQEDIQRIVQQALASQQQQAAVVQHQVTLAQPTYITLSSGSQYNGQQNAEGRPHGQGEIIYPASDRDISKYTGAFENGVPHGYGIMTFRDGDVFEGTHDQGKRVQGIMRQPNGAYETGIFKDGRIWKGQRHYLTQYGWRIKNYNGDEASCCIIL